MTRTSLTQTTRPRSGFTLIELLVVVSIALFLMAILVVAVRGVVGIARDKATTATIRKVDALLTKRIEGFERAIHDMNEAAGTGMPRYVTGRIVRQANGDAELAKVLGKKQYFKTHFPQTFAETGGQLSAGSGHNAATESAEVLYWLLTEAAAFGVEPVDTDAFTSNERQDTDGDGLMEFVDAWGNPLRFYRWPTRAIRAAASSYGDAQSVDTGMSGDPQSDWHYTIPVRQPYDTSSGIDASILLGPLDTPTGVVRAPGTTNPTFGQELGDPLARDPDDPLGLLRPIDSGKAAQQAANFENDFHTPDTFHLPLIVSAGGDGLLGLFEPHDTANHGRLAQPDMGNLEALLDNLTNRNTPAGGN